MKKTEMALATLAKIRDLLEHMDYGFDDPEAKQKFAGLVRILKMQVSGFLPNDTQQIYLGEQIGKLDEYKEVFFSGQTPRFRQTHRECQSDMRKACIIAQGLIERHATEHEELVVSGMQSS